MLLLLCRPTPTSASDPPCSSMMLPKYVEVFTSSKSSPSTVTGLVHAVLYRRILLLPLCILRPTDAEAVATLRIWSILVVTATSAFSASAGMLSDPVALPLLICVMARLISSIVGGPTLIEMSMGAASILGGFSGTG
ncbi:unnamed protein product [Schistosoma curassoni]|uniref:Secreted protein n=1 Tax=Schistosoma curassoni TaxID=6186 RepID=A0A183L052_9TREM|nr:unnamed protein product [Schistosoma curassoni]